MKYKKASSSHVPRHAVFNQFVIDDQEQDYLFQ